MKKRLYLFPVVLGIIFLLSVPSIVSAGKVVDNTEKTTFYAVIVGLKDLEGSYESAEKVKGALEKWPKSWQKGNINLLPKGKATKEKIEAAINDSKEKAKAGDEFLFYYVGHGSNGYVHPGPNGQLDTDPHPNDDVKVLPNLKKAIIVPGPDGKLDTTEEDLKGNDKIIGRKDGVKDHEETQADPKDEPDNFDNRIVTDQGTDISDDELSEMLSGFQYCVSIVIVLDACYTSTFGDGDNDPLKVKDEQIVSTAIKQKKCDKDVKACDVEMISAKDVTPTFPDSKTITQGFLEALEGNGKGKTRADAQGPDPDKEGEKGENDDITTLEEILKFITTSAWYLPYSVSYDNDGDGKFEEDYCDYFDFLNGTIYYAREDNDGDGLVDEDPDLIQFVFYEYVSPLGFGGISIPVDRFGLLAPYIALASTILVATAATAIYVKHVKRRKKK